jgi:hypothetical protein
MDKKKYITFEELFKVIEEFPSDNFFKSADLLMEALTDWPKEKEIAEVILELKGEIKDKLTYKNLDKYLETLNPKIDAWKIEALTSLLEMFDFERNKNIDKSIELETIVERLTHHYRQQFESYSQHRLR